MAVSWNDLDMKTQFLSLEPMTSLNGGSEGERIQLDYVSTR